ncbi:MAG: endolytic transglycosylase MltG, partial [Syntrophobacterales bacterium]
MSEQTTPDKKNRRLNLLWSLLLVLVLASAWLIGDMLHFLKTPASSEPQDVLMEVPVGMSVPALSELLHGQGLVRSAGKFRWLVRFKGAARQIKAGEYQLSTGLRPGELLDKIIRGEVR